MAVNEMTIDCKDFVGQTATLQTECDCFIECWIFGQVDSQIPIVAYADNRKIGVVATRAVLRNCWLK